MKMFIDSNVTCVSPRAYGERWRVVFDYIAIEWEMSALCGCVCIPSVFPHPAGTNLVPAKDYANTFSHNYIYTIILYSWSLVFILSTQYIIIIYFYHLYSTSRQRAQSAHTNNVKTTESTTTGQTKKAHVLQTSGGRSLRLRRRCVFCCVLRVNEVDRDDVSGCREKEIIWQRQQLASTTDWRSQIIR